MKNLWIHWMAAAWIAIPTSLGSQELSKESYEKLLFRHIGPVGNRTISVAGIPGDESTYIVGAASGGILKTEDAGLTWRPVFDNEPDPESVL